MLTLACALATAFTAPPASRTLLSRRVTMMADEEAAASPVFKRQTEQILSERFAVDYAAMGSMGAYMTIREDMTTVWNTCQDADSRLDQAGLAELLGKLGEDNSDAAVSKMFAAADQEGGGRILYEQWCKVRSAHCTFHSQRRRTLLSACCVCTVFQAFLDSCKPPEGEKRFFGLF